jgi:RNA polymerase-associated protein CTR9
LDNPKAPSDLWFALGLCYYRVNNFPKARLTFEKTLELDGKNAMALTSLGILELVSSPSNFESRKRALSYFIKGFEANPRNPLVLKYLAEHLFFKGEFATCKEFCGIA